MEAIWPEPADDLDVEVAVAAEARIHDDGRPWVTMLMISSLDGAAAIDGASAGLGAAADKTVFGAFRSMCDVVVVGGGTARAENYGPIPRRSPAVVARREARGQAARPRLAVVSASLGFDAGARIFADPEGKPLLYTTEDSPSPRRSELASRAELVTGGSSRVDVSQVVHDLARRGLRSILLEGGPHLNNDFLGAQLVDEIHLSLAPVAVGGDSLRIIAGAEAAPLQGLALARIWAGDGLLFLRYVRANASAR